MKHVGGYRYNILLYLKTVDGDKYNYVINIRKMGFINLSFSFLLGIPMEKIPKPI